jgi:hypothetical protein
MCDCRKNFEAQALAMHSDINNAKASISGYMLIPSGFQYLACEVVGTRTTAKGKEIKQKKVINILGKFCMFCGEAFTERAF